ncbi:NAD-dependent epimerase/dehydratase family protein [Candidatus Actinomarina sp. HD9-500m-PIT-SAG01]|nr:NAD-dependent epimerase/dehydratase family protein [Candidatus Actinomarina sp. HD9-500m-PIT-SAG01]
MKKVIVTGGAGFIGSNLVKRLIEYGVEDILVIDDFSTGKEENLKELSNIRLIPSKLEDLDDIGNEFKGYDFCFHLAAGVGVQYIMNNLSESILTNIQGTHKVFEACKENDIPVLITSTSEVYGTSEEESWHEETKSLIGPTTKLRWSYAVSKMIDEFLALSEFDAGNLNPIIVRLFNTIGPNQASEFGMVVPKFVESALNNEEIVIHGDGKQSRSFTWVGDVINYFIKLSELKVYGEIFNIGQTEEISIKDLAELIIEISGSNSKIKYLSHEDVFGKKFEDPTRRTPNIDKIVNTTGIKPSYDIKTMIKEIVEFKRQD